jgi:hypothetical protein
MRYIEKIAAPLVINLKDSVGDRMIGAYISPKDLNSHPNEIRKAVQSQYKHTLFSKDLRTKDGIILANQGLPNYNFKKGNNVITHELTHYLRDKKNKWSARNYNTNPAAVFIEELAAYKRGGAKLHQAVTGGVGTVLNKYTSKGSLPRKIFDGLFKIK